MIRQQGEQDGCCCKDQGNQKDQEDLPVADLNFTVQPLVPDPRRKKGQGKISQGTVVQQLGIDNWKQDKDHQKQNVHPLPEQAL